jgi:GMP synthase (glutamine-hydrolysing)
MNMQLVEPLRELFKDEVRELGASLGLPDAFVAATPSPAPASPSASRRGHQGALRHLAQGDAIYLEEIRAPGSTMRSGRPSRCCLPVRTVGVMGDARTTISSAACAR